MARLRRDERGAAAIMFAVSLVLLVPLIIGVFEVYYGAEQRGKLQDSLDAAALFAARSTATDKVKLTEIGTTALKANYDLEDGAEYKSIQFNISDDTVVADVVLQPASLLAAGSTLWRHPDMTVHAEVNRAMDKLEVALVLDNTGSMGQNNKLASLKTAATNLVDTLVTSTANSTVIDPLKISLVPFSNTVRVQTTTSLASYNVSTHSGGVPTWLDPQGKSHQVGGVNKDSFLVPNTDRFAMTKYLKANDNSAIGWGGCVESRPQPYDVQDDAPNSGIPATMYVPYFWPDEADEKTRTTKFYPPSSNSVYYNDSDNDYIDDVRAWSSTLAYAKEDIVSYTLSIPAWSSSTNYAIGDVVTYNGSGWKAKAANKGKTPSGSSTSWVAQVIPTYWRAASANTNKTPSLTSTYWTGETFRDPAIRQANVAKYGTTVGGVKISVSGDYGPNRGCGLQPVIRLTKTTNSIKTAINAMTATGETHIPIGLAWGWNTLSSNGPFGDGEPYDTPHVRKIVILMTDGENTMGDPGGSDEPNKSTYSGYGFIWQSILGLLPSANNSTRTSAIDARLSQLCTNMKAKGIVIYTVRVEVTSGSSDLLKNCATSPDRFYDVAQASQLNSAFQAIARSIDNLRISK